MRVEILIGAFRVVLTKKETFEKKIHKEDVGIVKLLSEKETFSFESRLQAQYLTPKWSQLISWSSKNKNF